MTEDEVYKIPMTTTSPENLYGYSLSYTLPKAGRQRTQLERREKVDVTNKEVENLLTGLMLAFEKSSSQHYGVKRAKTTLTVTKTGEGKAELSLGLGIIKLFDAEGKVTGEVVQGIEIEIERREDKQ